mgnify:CR=1 FL=1
MEVGIMAQSGLGCISKSCKINFVALTIEPIKVIPLLPLGRSRTIILRSVSILFMASRGPSFFFLLVTTCI